MPDDLVVDASVAAKLFFVEDLSDRAEAALREAGRLIAPELLFVEIASVAAKQVRRGVTSPERAAGVVASVIQLMDEVSPLSELARRAFVLAEAHGFSAYDGTYLALAEARGLRLITADEKLVRKAGGVGLSHLVRSLSAWTSSNTAP